MKPPQDINDFVPPVLTARELTKQQENILIWEMRRAGWSASSIAYATGIPRKKVISRIRRMSRTYAKRLFENVDDVRNNELIYLEKCREALAPKVGSGDSRAIEVSIKIGERIAALKGLDAPTRTETNVSGTVGVQYRNMTLEQLTGLAQDLGIKVTGPSDVPLLPGETVQEVLPEIPDAEFVATNPPPPPQEESPKGTS